MNAEFHAAVLARPCVECNVQSGRQCMTYSNKPTKVPHMRRVTPEVQKRYKAWAKAQNEGVDQRNESI